MKSLVILCLIVVACLLACVSATAQIDDGAARATPGGVNTSQPTQPSDTFDGDPPREQAALAADSPLRFRRVYVPQEQLLERVKSGRRYVPMKAADFESQLARLRGGARTSAHSPAHLAYATYAATLDDSFQLAGRGVWTVQLAGKEPVLLPLPGLGFALKEPGWRQTDAAARSETARLGSTAQGHTALHVDRSGSVEFDWSLQGSQDRDGAWVYALSFPPAPSQQLELTLPAPWAPNIEGGIVSSTDDAGRATRTWKIHLAGRSEAELRVVKEDSPLARRPIVLVRPRLTYELTALGLQLSADLRLDIHGRSIRELQIDLDPALTLASAKIGDATIALTEDSDEKQKHLTLEFPEPLVGNNRLIRLTAIAPPVIDQPWTLPKLRFRDTVWQEGTITLVVPAPLALRKLDLADCRQTKRETLPGPLAGEAIGIQSFSTSASVTVQVAEQSDRLQLTSATTVDLSGDEARAAYLADIAADSGERFELVADISGDWIIDSVQSSPPGLIADWDRTRSASGAGRLVIQLARAVTPERPLRLNVQATRRRAPLGDTLTAGNLEVLRFEGVVPKRRLMLVRPSGQYRLDLEGAEVVTRLDPTRLAPTDRSLVGDAPRGLLFVLDEGADDLKLRLLQEKPRFSAAVQARALVGNDELTESYRLHISPESGELDKLRVYFSRGREAGFTWLVEDNPSYEVIARRLPADEHAAIGARPGAEVWELSFRPALAEPIEMVISRRSRLEAKTSVSLVSAVDAASQQGSVAIELASERLPKVEQRRMKPLALESPGAGRQQNLLNAFEYDLTETLLAVEEPAIDLHVDRGADHRRSAWIWRCDLNSSLSSADSATHRATLLVENTGRSDLSLDLPAAKGFIEVRIDGARQVDGVVSADDGKIRIPLPAGRRFCSVDVEWNTAESGLAAFSSRSVEWPLADVPILARSATVWLPVGYKVANSSQVRRAAAGEFPSWRQRLFGPLGRGNDRETFEPWLARDWSRMGREFSDAAFVRRCAMQFLEQPLSDNAADIASNRSAEVTSIGERLDRAWRQVGQTLTAAPLFVHVDALKRAGVSPSADATADKNAGSVPANVGEWLRQMGLVLTYDRHGLLLTSREWAASACDPSVAVAREPLGELESSQTLDQLLASTAAGGLGAAVPLETWLALPEGVQSPWPTANVKDRRDQVPDGLVAFPLESFAQDNEIRFGIIRRDTLLALAIAVFLTAAGLVWRLGGVRPRFRAIALAILVMAALLIPVDFVPLGAAAVLGFLAGQLCRWCFRWPAPRARPIELDAASPVATPATLLLALVVALPQAAAQAPDNSGTSNVDRIYDVLIPIDDKENATSDLVYVPVELYQKLAVRNEDEQTDASGFLVKSATYEPVSTAGNQVAPQDWKATYTIESLKPKIEVMLPLAAAGADLIPDGATIDGQPLRFAWNAKRTGIVFNVSERGSYTVGFQFRPQAQRAAGGRAFNVSVPAVPNARVRLPAVDPARAPRVEALGASGLDRATGYVEVELGPMQHLAVRWDAAAGERMPVQFDADELMWLRLRPGSALFNVRLVVNVRQGALDALRLAVDPRLAFVSANDGAGEIKANPAGDGELRLYLGHSVADRAVIDLAFVSKDGDGVGRIEWPKLRLLGSQSSRRYAAWTVDPSLEWTASPNAEMKPIASSQFAALWGEPEGRPVAYELPAADSSWQLEVQARQARVVSSDRTIAIVQRDVVSIDWISSVEISGGSRFGLRSITPPELIVDEVEVRDAAGIRPIRWAKSSDHVLSVFFDAPATGRQQILVRARMPIGQGGRVSAPLLKLEDATIAAHSALVLRGHNMLASVGDMSGVSAHPAAEAGQLNDQFAASGLIEPSRFRELRLVAALAARADTRALLLDVKVNRPNANAKQAISLSKSGEIWHAALDLELNVQHGQLDTIRIDVPASWTGPFRLEPQTPFELQDVPGETRRQLLLRPAVPVAGETKLRIEGPLTLQPGQRARAPEARFVSAANRQEFFALPAQQDLRTLAWDTRGLKPEPIPEGLIERPAGVQAYQTFVRAGEEVRAELRSVDPVADDVQVRLADIVVHWNSDGSCYGAAAFDVEPAGRTSCRLAMPPNHRLVNLSIDGRPLSIEPAGNERWTVPLSGARLPQRIEIVYAGHFDNTLGIPQLVEGPRLIGLPVERTLWTVSGPHWAGAGHSDLAEATSALRQNAARHESIAAVIESAANSLAESSPEETPRWYAPWASYLTTAGRAIEAQIALGMVDDADREAHSNAELIAEDQHFLAERFGVGAVLDQLSDSPPAATSATAVWRTTLKPPAVATHAVLLGENPSFALTYSHQSPGDLGVRVVQVLVVAVLLLLAAGLIVYTPLVAWASQRPRAIGVAVGIFWWLFLWPSALGWLIVLASLVWGRLGRLVTRRIRSGLRPRVA
jgi:hypothetical protein